MFSNGELKVNLQINPKTWPQLKVNDLIEISLNTASASQSNPGSAGMSTVSDDESSPFLLQVVPSSFTDAIQIDTIRIDQAASTAPFFIKNLAFVNASKVDKAVRH